MREDHAVLIISVFLWKWQMLLLAYDFVEGVLVQHYFLVMQEFYSNDKRSCSYEICFLGM